MKAVYSIDDLTDRAVLDASADKPARLAVIGHPVAHSASPPMHQAALDAAGIDARYIRLDVEPGGVAEALHRMQALDFIGCNVTVPHKIEVMDSCDWIDPAAQALGAVNTVKFEADGRVSGCNTDAPGFRRAVEEAFGRPLSNQRVLIVGAGGGAGQAVAMACLLAGVRELVLVNRTVSKLDPLIDRLQQANTGCRIHALGLSDAALVEAARLSDLIVNTSSLGLKPGDPPVLGPECLVAGQSVYDTIYQPPVTPLLAIAEAAGCRTANGLSMLIHQGALAFQWWFPGSEPLARMREALTATTVPG